MTQPDPNWILFGDYDEEEFYDDFDYDHEDDDLRGE